MEENEVRLLWIGRRQGASKESGGQKRCKEGKREERAETAGPALQGSQGAYGVLLNPGEQERPQGCVSHEQELGSSIREGGAAREQQDSV